MCSARRLEAYPTGASASRSANTGRFRRSESGAIAVERRQVNQASRDPSSGRERSAAARQSSTSEGRCRAGTARRRRASAGQRAAAIDAACRRASVIRRSAIGAAEVTAAGDARPSVGARQFRSASASAGVDGRRCPRRDRRVERRLDADIGPPWRVSSAQWSGILI